MMLVSALVSDGAVESSRGTPNRAKSLVVTLMPNFTASKGETCPIKSPKSGLLGFKDTAGNKQCFQYGSWLV